MNKISYGKDVDTLLIELSNEAIAYAEDEGNVILHYSQDDKLSVVEILDFRRLLSSETIRDLGGINRHFGTFQTSSKK